MIHISNQYVKSEHFSSSSAVITCYYMTIKFLTCILVTKDSLAGFPEKAIAKCSNAEKIYNNIETIHEINLKRSISILSEA